MTVFTILLNGDVVSTTRLKQRIEKSRVIAADGGIRHAALLAIKPELWLGDFDSTNYKLSRNFATVEKRHFPVKKDVSDGEIAVNEALARGADEVILCGAFGGARFDYALSHVTLGLKLADAGIKVLLTSGDQEGIPLRCGVQQFDFADNTPFSIIGLTRLEDLSITGAAWQLSHRDVEFGSSLTLSNTVCGKLTVNLGKGSAILIARF